MTHHKWHKLLYMVSNLGYYYNYFAMFTSGPPTFQPFDPVHYVIVGHSFVLNCTATNDPQSPNNLTFRWYKDSNRIRKNNKQFYTTEHLINPTTVTSQLVISDLQVIKHNGTYICEVHNYNEESFMRQKTVVVVESKFINMHKVIHSLPFVF